MFSHLLQLAQRVPLLPLGMAMGQTYVLDIDMDTCVAASLTIPHRARSNEVAPRLLVDNCAYTFGKGESRSEVLHAAYIALLEQYITETHDGDGEAVLAYLTSHREPPLELTDQRTPINFRRDGRLLVESPDLIHWWQDYLFRGKEGSMVCAVCGQKKPFPSAPHPKIIGLPAPHTFGTALSPKASNELPTVCGLCGATIVAVLNFLLASPQHHRHLGDVVAVYWSSGEDCSAALVGEQRGVLGHIPTEGIVRVYLLKDQHKRLSVRGLGVFDLKEAAPHLARFRVVQEAMTKTPALAPLAMAQILAPVFHGSGEYATTALALVEMAFGGHALPLSVGSTLREWIQRTGGDPLGARLAALVGDPAPSLQDGSYA